MCLLCFPIVFPCFPLLSHVFPGLLGLLSKLKQRVATDPTGESDRAKLSRAVRSPLRSRAPHASGGLPLGDCCSHCPPRSSLSWFAIGLDIRRLLLVLRSVFFRPGWAPVTFTGPYNSGFTVGWYTGWAPDLIDPLQQIQWCILGLECC